MVVAFPYNEHTDPHYTGREAQQTQQLKAGTEEHFQWWVSNYGYTLHFAPGYRPNRTDYENRYNIAYPQTPIKGGRRMRYKSTRRRGKTNRRRVKTHRRRHRKH
jgi:hypothetical protein